MDFSSIFKLPVNCLDLIAWLVFWLYVGRLAMWMSSKIVVTICSFLLPPCCAFQSQYKINEDAEATESSEDKSYSRTDKMVLYVDPNLSQSENQNVTTGELKKNEVVEVEEEPVQQKIQKEDDDSNSAVSEGVSKRFRCKMCVVQCVGEAAWKSHVIGKKHQAKNRHMIHKAKGDYWCSYCDADCRNWNNLSSHLIGKKHLSNIQEVVSC